MKHFKCAAGNGQEKERRPPSRFAARCVPSTGRPFCQGQRPPACYIPPMSDPFELIGPAPDAPASADAAQGADLAHLEGLNEAQRVVLVRDWENPRSVLVPAKKPSLTEILSS